MPPKKAAEKQEVSILEVHKGSFTACVLGTTPIYLNRLSEKVMRELLMPRGKRNAAERATTLKHDPYEEFRSSPHRFDDASTYLAVKSAGFKKGMGIAALDLPGTKKAQIGLSEASEAKQ